MKDIILKQTIMNKVLYSLIPVILFSIYLFGWRVMAVIVVSNIAAFLTEYLFIRNKKNGKVSMAVFVTGTLLALTLPPTIPLWMAAVGSIVAVAFGKMVFGGFGTNIFNPAILGRTFVYISFPQQMTVSWIEPFKGFPGGLLHYAGSETMRTSATILSHYRHTGQISETISNAFLGFIPGSIGETSALLLLLGGIYMIITKTASWKPMVSTTISLIIFNIIFYPHENPFFFLVSAGAMFGIIYMTTDPVSQAKGKIAIWIYGILCGFLTVLIRKYSLFYEGFMFALLLTNSFMPIIEYALNRFDVKKKGGLANG